MGRTGTKPHDFVFFCAGSSSLVSHKLSSFLSTLGSIEQPSTACNIWLCLSALDGPCAEMDRPYISGKKRIHSRMVQTCKRVARLIASSIPAVLLSLCIYGTRTTTVVVLDMILFIHYSYRHELKTVRAFQGARYRPADGPIPQPYVGVRYEMTKHKTLGAHTTIRRKCWSFSCL